MLSQVERGETSPTLQVARRIAAGLELRLSQLLRLDEDGAVSVVRADERRKGPGRVHGHSYEILTPPLPGQRAELSRHTLSGGAVTGGPGDPPMHEPGSRETALVEAGTRRARLRRRADRACRGRQRDVRRRPSAPFRKPRTAGGRAARGRERGPEKELGTRCPNAAGQDLGRPRGRPQPDLHRPASGPRGDEPAGVRRPPAGRPHGAPPRPDARHRRPQRAHRRDAVAAQIRDELSRMQVETLERNCAEFGVPLYSLGSEHQGIVHVIGPELGRHPARDDDRLRRLPHRDPRGVRGAGVRDRDQRGRARAGHPDAGPGQAQVDADPLRRASSASASAPRTWSWPRSGRWASPAASATRSSTPGPAIETLSMEGRMTVCNMTIEGGGRAGHGRPRRHHLRVGDRPSRRAVGGPGRVARAAAPTPARRSTARSTSTPARSARWSPGARTRGWSSG